MKNTPQFPLTLAFVTVMIASCATYSVPPAVPVSDQRVAGVYETRYMKEGEDVVVELFLFRDGYFHEMATYKEGEPYSDFGVYRFSADTMEIEFLYDADSAKWNFTAHVEEDFESLSEGADVFKKLTSETGFSSMAPIKEEIAATYVLSYESEGEDVFILLTLRENGRFVDRFAYPDDEGMLTEKGDYLFSPTSGIVAFEYDDWPAGNFLGRLGEDSRILYALEGHFRRVDENGDVPGLHIPGFVRNLIPAM